MMDSHEEKESVSWATTVDPQSPRPSCVSRTFSPSRISSRPLSFRPPFIPSDNFRPGGGRAEAPGPATRPWSGPCRGSPSDPAQGLAEPRTPRIPRSGELQVHGVLVELLAVLLHPARGRSRVARSLSGVELFAGPPGPRPSRAGGGLQPELEHLGEEPDTAERISGLSPSLKRFVVRCVLGVAVVGQAAPGGRPGERCSPRSPSPSGP